MKKLLLASILAAMTSVATAGVVSLPSGVSYQPNTDINADEGIGSYSNPFNFVQWWDDSNTDTNGDSLSDFTFDSLADFERYKLNGLGELSNVNTDTVAALTCGSCEITFRFGDIGLMPTVITNPDFTALVDAIQNNIDNNLPVDLNGQTVADYARGFFTGQEFITVPTLDISNGYLDVYVDYSGNNFQYANISSDGEVTDSEIESAADSSATPFLKLKFVELSAKLGDEGFDDDVFGLSSLDTFFGLNVAGTDVATGGTAFANFSTQGIRALGDGISGIADVVGLGLSQTFLRENVPGAKYDVFAATNRTGSISGFAVSAPSTIAFMGLGLFGLAFAARRRNK
jgi:hypothetical protein